MPAHKGAGRTRRVLVLNLIGHVLAIALFVHGYLLTRIHLPYRSDPSSPVCARPYKKLVWIVIDALRSVTAACHRSLPPLTLVSAPQI